MSIKKQKKHVCLVNWKRRVLEAKKNGTFSSEDQRDASNWNQCALGEGKTQLTKYNLNVGFLFGGSKGWYSRDQLAPIDKRLENLGVKFSEYVNANNSSYALRILNLIEKRLNELYVVV